MVPIIPFSCRRAGSSGRGCGSIHRTNVDKPKSALHISDCALGLEMLGKSVEKRAAFAGTRVSALADSTRRNRTPTEDARAKGEVLLLNRRESRGENRSAQPCSV